jgi:transcriptional/translational regulatory protein YebC/TACO1
MAVLSPGLEALKKIDRQLGELASAELDWLFTRVCDLKREKARDQEEAKQALLEAEAGDAPQKGEGSD